MRAVSSPRDRGLHGSPEHNPFSPCKRLPARPCPQLFRFSRLSNIALFDVPARRTSHCRPTPHGNTHGRRVRHAGPYCCGPARVSQCARTPASVSARPDPRELAFCAHAGASTQEWTQTTDRQRVLICRAERQPCVQQVFHSFAPRIVLRRRRTACRSISGSALRRAGATSTTCPGSRVSCESSRRTVTTFSFSRWRCRSVCT